MNKKLMLLSLVFYFLMIPLQAGAAYIVDTGQPTDTVGTTFNSQWWYSAEFTVDAEYNLTDIEGWIRTSFWGGPVDIAIYKDGGDLPDTNNEIYRSDFQIQGTASADLYDTDWHGLTNLSWALDAGTYWVAFEVRDSNYQGTVPGSSPNPIVNEAYANNGTWFGWDVLNMGIRIQGEPIVSPVPEPATMMLFGAGLIGLAGVHRKKYLKSNIETNFPW